VLGFCTVLGRQSSTDRYSLGPQTAARDCLSAV